MPLPDYSFASAIIRSVTGPAVDDDEATARSLIGRMASATLSRPISCSNVAAATRPSRDLGDSSESPGRRMSHPGVQGNDVTGDVAGSSSVLRLLSPDGPGSCGSGGASDWSGSDGITTTDWTGGSGSRSSARSWR